MKREITKKRLLVFVFSVLSGGLLTFSQSFSEVWTTDCDFGMKDVFGSNEPVCLTGTLYVPHQPPLWNLYLFWGWPR